MLNLKNELIDIIKIGGAIITDKNEYRSLRKKQLSLISKEIAQWNRKSIIIHGAGSFGHIVAKQYSIHLGFSYQDQIKGVLQIRRDMAELSQAVINSLIEEGGKALAFQTSSIVYEDKKGYSVQNKPINKALALGFNPVLSGDILFTENRGFRILSGDTLTNLMVKYFDVRRVIFISDVDGIFVQNDKTGENELANNLSSKDLERIKVGNLEHKDSRDVTGEMKGKISEIKRLLEKVSEVIVVNGYHPERLTAIRNGKNFIGTKLTSEKSTER